MAFSITERAEASTDDSGPYLTPLVGGVKSFYYFFVAFYAQMKFLYHIFLWRGKQNAAELLEFFAAFVACGLDGHAVLFLAS